MAAYVTETGQYVRRGEILVVDVPPNDILLIQGTRASFWILNPRDEETGKLLPPKLIDPRSQFVTRPESSGGHQKDRVTIIPSP